MPDPHQLGLRTFVNDELRQESNTKELIFDCFALVEHLSTAFTLEPGDIIATDGTGAVCLPAARAGEITALAEAMARDDAGAVEDLRAGLSFAQAMAKYRDI